MATERIQTRSKGSRTPGYLERVYRDWCRSQGRSAKRILILRGISTVNVLLAAVAFIGLVSR